MALRFTGSTVNCFPVPKAILVLTHSLGTPTPIVAGLSVRRYARQLNGHHRVIRARIENQHSRLVVYRDIEEDHAVDAMKRDGKHPGLRRRETSEQKHVRKTWEFANKCWGLKRVSWVSTPTKAVESSSSWR